MDSMHLTENMQSQQELRGDKAKKSSAKTERIQKLFNICFTVIL